MIKKLLLGFVLLLILAPIVSAAEANFTPIIPVIGGDDEIHPNQTFVISDRPFTPFPVWLIVIVLAFGTFFASLILKPEQCNDICAYLSPIFTAFGIYMSFGIDMVTGFGVASSSEPDLTPPITTTAHEWILMENHTIYHPEPFIILLVIIFIISLANVLRVYLQHRELKLGEVNADNE